jgi:hypothetical protein
MMAHGSGVRLLWRTDFDLAQRPKTVERDALLLGEMLADGQDSQDRRYRTETTGKTTYANCRAAQQRMSEADAKHRFSRFLVSEVTTYRTEP